MRSIVDIETQHGEAHATIAAIGNLLWGRAATSDEISQDEALSIGQSLAGAAKSIDKAFYELTSLHASMNKGGEKAPSTSAEWRSPPSSARNVDELSFTSRDPEGGICWWSVTPPKTEYWDAHVALGRAYAYEFLDLVHNQDKTEPLHKQTFGGIAGEIVRTGHTQNDGLYCGFFGAISEYLITGIER